MKNRVYELRKKKGWSLRYLAKKSGVGRRTINQFERGIGNPRSDTFTFSQWQS